MRKKPTDSHASETPRGRRADEASATEASELRIIGGKLRGRKIAYVGDPRTRPMKERVREALFNLVGPSIADSHAIDLFAGTGALGFEALSRGAARAVFLEKHFPTADAIRKTAAELEIAERCEVLGADTLLHVRRLLRDGECFDRSRRWTVFCSPPYEFFVSRLEETLQLLTGLIDVAPPQSIFVVESDGRFDTAQLPNADRWRVREYYPAVVAIMNTGEPQPTVDV